MLRITRDVQRSGRAVAICAALVLSLGCDTQTGPKLRHEPVGVADAARASGSASVQPPQDSTVRPSEEHELRKASASAAKLRVSEILEGEVEPVVVWRHDGLERIQADRQDRHPSERDALYSWQPSERSDRHREGRPFCGLSYRR